MKFFNLRKNMLCLTLILSMIFPMLGATVCAGIVTDVSLSSPNALQVYEPLDTVNINGTAAGLSEVAVAVRNAQNKLIFAAQPKVKNGVFNCSFELEEKAAGGKYTIIIGSMGAPNLERKFIVSSSADTEIALEKPTGDMKYKPGDKVEIAGTAQSTDCIAVCVRNNQGGRIFADQPPVTNGTFNTSFNLPRDVISGNYNICITASGLKAAQNYALEVSSQGGGSGDDPLIKDALIINGNGVDNVITFSEEDLKEMYQVRTVFSVTSDLPEDLVVAAEGIPLADLLGRAGIKNKAKMITFTGSDGYKAEFTIDQLLGQTRYAFPSKQVVEPLIALKRAERSSNYDNMTSGDAPVLCFGQRAKTDQTLFSFVKRLKYITVSTSSPKQWNTAGAEITVPNSKAKTLTEGGEVVSGSKVYLTCEPGGKIYYTTDGSIPNLDSRIFNPHGCGPNVGKYDPVVVTEDTVVRAMVVGNGKTDSNVATYKFTVAGSSTTSPVIDHSVSEKNTKKETSKTDSGRRTETITLLSGIADDIERGEKGCRLAISSNTEADEVRVIASLDSIQKAKAKGMMLGVDTQNGSYTLPLNSINLETIAAEMGVEAKDLNFVLTISKVTDEAKNKLAGKIEEGQQMLTLPLEFTLEILAPDGKKKEIKYFGGTYAERTIVMDSSSGNYNRATGVVFDEESGGFMPVPTRFENRNGKMNAVLLSRTNSLYTVLQSNKTFTDIKNNWAKEDIEILASKMLISGRNKTEYEPNGNITRAEFAALLVRALGLEKGKSKEGQFADIPAGSWFAGSVAAAAREKIITGYDNNMFKPNKNITREEMAVMIARAAKAAGKTSTLSTAENKQLLSQFKDNSSISDWAKKDAAMAIKSGIMSGMPNKEFSPNTYADRAQSAAILRRFMVHINFMTIQ